MAELDIDYNYLQDLDTKLAKQCSTIRHYEKIMKELYEYIKTEHTADEYKEFIKSHIWIQLMEE